jgi:hypothetical protein
MKTTKLLVKGLALVSILGVFILGSCDGFAPTIKVPFNSESDFSLAGSSGKSLAVGEELIEEMSKSGEEINALITEFAPDADLQKIKDGYVKNVTLKLKDVPENQNIDLTTFVTSFRLTVSNYNSTSKTEEQLVATTKEVKAREITFELGEVGILDFVTSGNGITFKLYGEYNKANVPQIGIPMNLEAAAELVVALLEGELGEE